jgi:hypothetical protein
MSEREHYEEKEEKEEKEEEKEDEKQEKEEKSWDEKYRRDPLSAVVWAIILIWVGIVLLGENLGLLRGFRLGARGAVIGTWDLIFIGAGLLIIIEAVIRLLVPEYRRPIVGTIIFGAIVLSIGLGNVISWGAVWAVVLIVLGGGMLLRGLRRGD